MTDQLDLIVGCTFGFSASQPTSSVVQVAPAPQADTQMVEERWETGAPHHTYVDGYGNRCERFLFPAGPSTLSYSAELLHTDPDDPAEIPFAAEIPPVDLPDDVLSFLMPSRFCQPDELGNEAWTRFGEHEPGSGRVQAVVDYV